MFLNIVEILSDQVGTESTEAGKMLPLAPSGSENLSNATSQLEGVGCPVGVAVTIAGGGGGLFFSLFSQPFAVKKQAEGTKRPRTFFAIGNCESCTRPISTNPESMEAGEYGLTHGTWFFARRLEVVAVARLLWI